MEKFLRSSNFNDTNDTNIEHIGSDSSEENVLKKRTKIGKSKVCSYFKRAKDGKTAKCIYCYKIYKTSGNTFNLFDHLKRSHPTLQDLPMSSGKIVSYMNNSEKYETSSARKQFLDSSLVSYISLDIQPFSVVEDKGFRQFVKALDPRYELPSPNTLLNNHIASLFEDMKIKLYKIIDDVEHCAITMDCWSSSANEGYLTVTCHFITRDFVLRTAVLSTKKLLDEINKSAENISESLRAVLDEWKIFNKITAIVTDNDKTMLKACEILQKRNLPCFAHSLNLVVQDCLSFSKNQDILSKCKRIVTYFKSSTIAYAKFRAAQGTGKVYSLKQEVPTRWNSAFLMIQRILLTKDAIGQVLLNVSKAPPPLTADEIATLQDLVQLLSPFEDATVKSSSSTFVTVSLTIPMVCGLLHTLENLKTSLITTDGLDICMFMIERIKKRLMFYEERTVTRLGTLLDTRFKKEGFRSCFNATEAGKILENEIAHLNKAHPTIETSEPPTSISKSGPSQQPLLFMEKNITNKVRNNRVDAIVALRQYFENSNSPQDSNILEFWKFHPNDTALKSCAARFLSVPATSTESERMFSKAGIIVSERRASLKAKHVGMLVFINKNS